ncbi:MAG: arsenate reductase (glutaredoxin) [Thermoanaerobaculia bacterium]
MKDAYIHNPSCSKSRQGLELLRERGADMPVRLYLDEPLTADELRELVQILGVRPIDVVRTKEPLFEELGLSTDSPDATVIDAIAKNPILLERPILVRNGKAAIGRPTENLERLLTKG